MRSILCLLALLLIVGSANARPRRAAVVTSKTASCSSSMSCANGICTTSTQQTTTTTAESVSEAVEALAEVNARRARSGLRPFIQDPLLTEGAKRCAIERARRGLFGHLPSDFAYLPPGAQARAGGCAAYPPSMGWYSCCCEDNATYAGAAWAMGRDGRRYMHLFVR